MFNKKLREGLALVTSDIFTFHEWFYHIKEDIEQLKALEKAAKESIAVQGRTQDIQEQALKMITTNSGRIDDVAQ